MADPEPLSSRLSLGAVAPQETSTLPARRIIIALVVVIIIVLIVVITRAAQKRRSAGSGSGTYVIDADMVGDRLRPGSDPHSMRFFVGDDPAGGFVDYDTWKDLIFYDPASERTIMKVSAPGNITSKGRRALRLVSQNRYDTGLFVISADHIPEGNGTWPAFWLTAWEPPGSSWACHGEIDIIEGVNSIDPSSSANEMTLHTSDSAHSYCRQKQISGNNHGIDNSVCSMASDRKTAAWCGHTPGPQLGCGVVSSSNQTFGFGFNRAGGGVYATELLPNGAVTIWYFPIGSEPADIAANTPEPSKWPVGNIMAAFNPCPGSFAKLQIVLNTTLCGRRAGAVYPGGKDSQTKCNAVMTNSDLSKAFWSIEYIKAFRRRDSPTSVTPEPQPWRDYDGGHTECGSGCAPGQKCLGGLCVRDIGRGKCPTSTPPTTAGNDMYDNQQKCCSACAAGLEAYHMVAHDDTRARYFCHRSAADAAAAGRVIAKGAPMDCSGDNCCAWTSGKECPPSSGKTVLGGNMYAQGCCIPCQTGITPYLVQLGGSGPGTYRCYANDSDAAAGGNTVLASGPTC